MKYILITFSILLFNSAFSQTGPGGVGSADGTSDLEFWYMADGENYGNGDLVNSVTDRSGNSRTLSAAGGERPTFNSATAGANNMSSFTFALNDELETTYQGNSNENMTFGLIQNYTNDGGLNVAIQHGGRNTMSASSAHAYFDFVGGSGHTSGTTANSNWNFLYQQFANSGSPRLNYYVNNTNTDNFTHNIENRTSNTWIGGHGPGGGTGWNGGIAEVFKFSRVLNQAERIIIANYLAAKYGITLTANDIYNEDNGGYDYDVAGIGQASDGSRHDDSQGTGMVRMRNPSGMGNNEYLFWGHDNGAADATETSDVPGSIDARFERVWRVSEVNESGSGRNVGNVDMRWDLSSYSPITTSDLRLLIDTDNDGIFSDETPIGPPTSLGGGIYEFAAVSGTAAGIRNNRRFTLGTINSTQTPLPVELVEFRAEENLEENVVDLFWVTASEINNDYFTIEKSKDLEKFHVIKTVPGQGTTNEQTEYHEVDEQLTMGLSYYRLSQTDFNGTTTNFDIEKLLIEQNKNEEAVDVQLYPNPNNGHHIFIKIPNHSGDDINLLVNDFLGKEFATDFMVVNHGNFSIVSIELANQLAPGTYIININAGGTLHQHKLIVK